MKLDENNNILADWLSGKISQTELESLKKEKHFYQFEEIINELDKLIPPEYSSEKEWDALRNKLQAKPKVIQFKSLSMAIAASVVLFIGIWFLININTVNIKTVASQKETIELPDGSEVILNAASKIKYNSKKWDQERRIILSGEAFFKVKKGNSFIVKTKFGKIEVLGTSFNVYQREILEVACFTGKVKVVANEADQAVDLNPGNKVRFTDGKYIKMQEDEEQQPSWISNESRFKNTPLQRVIHDLEIQYNVEFIYDEVPDMNFSGTFPHSDLNMALKIVFDPMNIKYKQSKKSKIILEFN